MTKANSKHNVARTTPTGVPGLDTISRYGFYRGGIYLVQGKPEAVKTNLVNQMLQSCRVWRESAFRHVLTEF